MLSPELTKFIFNYQNDNKEEIDQKSKKNVSQKTPLKSRSVKFMTKLGFIPVHIEK